MATSKLKQNLRYKKAHQRLCKEVLPACPQFRKLLNFDDLIERLSRDNRKLWIIANRKGFKPLIDNSNPEYFEHFDRLSINQKEIEQASKAIARIEKKGYSLEDAKLARYQLNAGRLSQSF
jgi:hypothetical protein